MHMPARLSGSEIHEDSSYRWRRRLSWSYTSFFPRPDSVQRLLAISVGDLMYQCVGLLSYRHPKWIRSGEDSTDRVGSVLDDRCLRRLYHFQRFRTRDRHLDINWKVDHCRDLRYFKCSIRNSGCLPCAVARYWPMRKYLLLALLYSVISLQVFGAAEVDPSRVVILANSFVPESVALAKYYSEKRGIPKENIISLRMPDKETISWQEYVDTIHNPLRRWLVKKGWMHVLGTVESDKTTGLEGGRVISHQVRYLVICQGTPLRISHNDALAQPEHVQAFRQNLPSIFRSAGDDEKAFNNYFAKTYASVDSELACLAMGDRQVVGFIPNPLFRQPNPGLLEEVQVIRTSRLGGPSFSAARALVDNAIRAEKEGLRGRAYIDRGGPYPLANTWLESAAEDLRKAGFSVSEDESKEVFAAGDRFDAPAIYLGWYTQDVTGPFKEPGFQFAPGAIAAHLHSFSARTLQKDDSLWVGPLVARGATATVGNVYEPTLFLTHHFDVLTKALLSGMTWGDAAWLATPTLSWQNITIGDPLYSPFQKPLNEQLKEIAAPHNAFLGQYIIIRWMNLLERQGERENALKFGKTAFNETPGIALALEIARLEAALGEIDSAAERLGFIRKLTFTTHEDHGVAIDTARFLASIKKVDAALDTLRFVRNQTQSESTLKRLRKVGRQIAEEAGRSTAEWQEPDAGAAP